MSCYVDWCLGILLCHVVFCVCGWHLTKLNGLPHCAAFGWHAEHAGLHGPVFLSQVMQATGCSHGKWSQNNLSLSWPWTASSSWTFGAEQHEIARIHAVFRRADQGCETTVVPKAGGYRWCADYWPIGSTLHTPGPSKLEHLRVSIWFRLLQSRCGLPWPSRQLMFTGRWFSLRCVY